MAIEKIRSMKNLEKVVSDDVTKNVHIDVVTADAYQDSITSADHLEDVITQLESKAEGIITENPQAVEPSVENVYTKKYLLDEAVADFVMTSAKPSKVYDDDEFDTYWDMDMFDFIYELVSITDTRRKPIDPLGRPHARFAVSGRDKYVGLTDEQIRAEKEYEEQELSGLALMGSPQVAAKDDYIEVYSHSLYRFNDIKEICKKYHFETVGPKETFKVKRNRFSMSSKEEWIQYEYAFRIYVPCDSSGIPLRIEDYFETYNLELEDVMNPEFCRHYRKIQLRIEKEAQEMLDKKSKQRQRSLIAKQKQDAVSRNEEVIEDIYKKYSNKAAWSNDPLESFIKDMFSELDTFRFSDDTKLKYSKTKLKSRFLAEFEDDFEEE